jgi:hypothetical protein
MSSSIQAAWTHANNHRRCGFRQRRFWSRRAICGRRSVNAFASVRRWVAYGHIALVCRLIALPSVLSGLDIYSAAKKFETGVLYDFADVEGFQQHSFVGHDLNFVTRAAGVLFMRP